MIQFTQFPFLQALGYAILNSLWQFAFLWLVYLMINCVAQLSPNKKYTAALTLQLAGFVWFVTTFVFYYKQCFVLAQSGQAISEISGFGNLPYTGSLKDKVLTTILRTELFLPYLALAYLVLLAIFSVKWITTFSNTQQLKKQGLAKVDYTYRLFVEKISFQFGIKRPVGVYLSSLVKSPLTVGFLKPIILLPVAMVNYLTCQQVEAILLHELAHIKRYDYLLNLFLSFIEITLFFNPFMQLLCRHLKRERENSCDDWVLQYEYSASDYAGALLKLARNNQRMMPVLALNAVDQKHTLLIRVKRMIEKQDRTL